MKIKIVEYWAFDGLVERYALRDGEKHILLGRLECSESFQYDDTEKYLHKYLPEARALACINWLIEINKFGRTCNPTRKPREISYQAYRTWKCNADGKTITHWPNSSRVELFKSIFLGRDNRWR